MAEESLDTWANKYQWSIEFEKLASVKAVLGYGKDLLNVEIVTKVRDGATLKIDDPTNQIFLSFTGDKRK